MQFSLFFGLPNVGKRDFRCFLVFPMLGNAIFAVFQSSQCWEMQFSLFFDFPSGGKHCFIDFWFSPPGGKRRFFDFWSIQALGLSVRFSHLKFYEWANEKIITRGEVKRKLTIIPVYIRSRTNAEIYNFRARPIELSIAYFQSTPNFCAANLCKCQIQ